MNADNEQDVPIVKEVKKYKQNKEYARAYYLANRQRITERVRKYHHEHKEVCNQLSREAYKANKEERLAYCKQWVEAHKEQYAAYKREYLEQNRERLKAEKRIYYQENKEKCNKASRDYALNNAEHLKLKNKEWRVANMDKRQAANRNRLALQMSAEGRHTPKDVAILYERQKHKCATCKKHISNKPGPSKYHVDHVMPLTKGGSNWPDNLQLLCPTCNIRKKNKHPDDWAKQNGMLFC